MHWAQEETSSLPAPCLPSGLITVLKRTLFAHSLITHPEHKSTSAQAPAAPVPAVRFCWLICGPGRPLPPRVGGAKPHVRRFEELTAQVSCTQGRMLVSS